MFLCNKTNIYIHPEIIDIAEVFKGIVETVAVKMMERHGEVFVLIGRVVNTFIPRLPCPAARCPDLSFTLQKKEFFKKLEFVTFRS